MKPAQSLTGVERTDDDADAVAEPPLEEAGLIAMSPRHNSVSVCEAAAACAV